MTLSEKCNMAKVSPSSCKPNAASEKTSMIATGTELEVLTLVNEMTQKVLIRQPKNIYLFCAEFLEAQLIEREAKARKEARKARRREKKKVKAVPVASPGELVMNKLTLGVTSGMQGNDPLREQVTVSSAGARGPTIPPIPTDFSSEPDTMTLRGHKGEVTQCCFFSEYVLTSSLDCTLRIWNEETGEEVQKMECEKPIHSFVLTSQKDKKVIFAALDDGRVVSWRLKFDGATIKAKNTNVVSCHQPNPIRAIAASPDGKLLATGCCFNMFQIPSDSFRTYEISVRGTLKVWNLSGLLDWALHPNRHYHDITFEAMKTMKQLVINSQSSETQRTAAGLTDSHYGIRAVAFSPDSKVIAVGFGTPAGNNIQDIRMVALCEAEKLETLWVQEHMDYQTNGLMFSNIGSGSFQAPWELFISSQQGIAKMSLFLSGDSQQRVKLRELWKEKMDGDHCGLCIAPNARLLASALEGALHIRDSASGKNVGVYPGHEKPVLQIAFSKEARVICTVSKDHTAKLWKFDSAKKNCDVLIKVEESLPHENVIPPISQTLKGNLLINPAINSKPL